jgi:hypothetical protein
MFPKVGNTGALPAATANEFNPATPNDGLPTATGSQPVVHQFGFNEMSPSFNTMMGNGIPASSTGSQPSVLPHGLTQISPSLKVTTGTLNVPNYANLASILQAYFQYHQICSLQIQHKLLRKGSRK